MNEKKEIEPTEVDVVDQTYGVIFNRTIGEDFEVLTVGFDEDGNVIPPSLSHIGPVGTTVQVKPTVIHTKETYKGDNPQVLEFFGRDESDPLYGYLLPEEKEQRQVLTNLASVHSEIVGYFTPYEENGYQPPIFQMIFTSMVGMLATDLLTDDFKRDEVLAKIDEWLKPLTEDYKPRDIGSIMKGCVLLRNINDVKKSETIVQNVTDYLVFINPEDGKLWHNSIMAPPVKLANSLALKESITAHCNCQSYLKLDPNITQYWVVSVERYSENKGIDWVANFQINKYVNAQSVPEDEENKDELGKESTD